MEETQVTRGDQMGTQATESLRCVCGRLELWFLITKHWTFQTSTTTYEKQNNLGSPWTTPKEQARTFTASCLFRVCGSAGEEKTHSGETVELCNLDQKVMTYSWFRVMVRVRGHVLIHLNLSLWSEDSVFPPVDLQLELIFIWWKSFWFLSNGL